MDREIGPGLYLSLSFTKVDYCVSVCLHLPTYPYIYLSIHLIFHVCVLCAEARGRCQVSSSSALYVIVETLTKSEACYLARLAGCSASSRNLPALNPQL